MTRLEIWRGAPGTGQLVHFDNGNYTDDLHIYQSPTLDDGEYTVRVLDQAGNDSPDYRFTIDRAPPSVTIQDGEPGLGAREHGPFSGPTNPDPDLWLHNLLPPESSLLGISLRALDPGGLSRASLSGERPILDLAVDGAAFETTLTAEVLPDSTGYAFRALDLAGNQTTVFFHVDSRAPRTDYEVRVATTQRPEGLWLEVRAVGVSSDATSGIAGVELISGEPGGTLPPPSFSGGGPPRLRLSSFTLPVPEIRVEIPGHSFSGGGFLRAGDAAGLLGDPMPIFFNRLLFADRNVTIIPQGPALPGETSAPSGEWFALITGELGNMLRRIKLLQPPETPCPAVRVWTRSSGSRREPQGESVGTVFEPGDTPEAIAFEGARCGEDLALALPLAPAAQARVDVLAPATTVHFVYGIETLLGAGLRQAATAPLEVGLNIQVDVAGVTVRLSPSEPGGVLGVVPGVPVLPPPGLRALPGIAEARAGTDIFTTAAFDGPVTLTLRYDPGLLTPEQQGQVRLYHLRGGAWEDITRLAQAGQVSGETLSLSIFALFISTAALPEDILGANPPGPLALLGRSGSALELAWGANGNPAGARYSVQYAMIPAFDCRPPQGAVYRTLETTANPFTLAGLEPSANYQINVCNPALFSQNTPACSPNAPIVARTGPPGSGTELNPPFLSCGDAGGGEEEELSGLAIAVDAQGRLWEVVQDGAGMRLARFSAQGELESEASLPGASDRAAWSLQFDGEGTAYAIGSASGSLGVGMELAVYRASPAGVLLSSAGFSGGPDIRALALDSAGEVLIAGTLQRGELFQGNAAFTLGLWKFCPHEGKLKLLAQYERGGGIDYGSGIRLVGTDIWVSGYSKNPDPAPGALPLDLALWRFDQNGALTLGPVFLPGYLSGLTEEIAAAPLEAGEGALYAAASRERGAEGWDLGLAKLDLEGRVLVERAWRPASGGTVFAERMGRAGNGEVVVAGKVEAEPERMGVIWRYNAEGGFVSARTPADVSGIKGLALAGEALWLAVNGSTRPFRVQESQEAAGQDILISSRSADRTPPETALRSPGGAGACAAAEGRVPVLGLVAGEDVKEWRLEAAAGREATGGFTLLSAGTAPVDGTLAFWDTGELSDFQTLRLTALDLAGNVSQATSSVFVGDPVLLGSLGDKKTLNKPEDAAVGEDGRVYAADTNDGQVEVFGPDGNRETPLGTGKKNAEPNLDKPRAVAVDAQGNLYVADSQQDRILKLSPAGAVLLQVPGFKHPSGIAVDKEGKIYVSDTGNRQVKVLSPEGSFLRSILLPPADFEVEEDGEEPGEAEGTRPGKPHGLDVDAAGNIYVAEPKGHRALKFGPDGTLLLSLGTKGSGPGQLRRPEGIAVSPDGNCLVVSDRILDRVQRFDSQGNLLSGFGEGLRRPIGLALAPDGSLWAADRNNDRLARYGLPGGGGSIGVAALSGERPARTRAAGRVDKARGGKVERTDKAGVLVPPHALAEDLELSLGPPEERAELESRERAERMAGSGLKSASQPVEYGPEGTRFAAPVTIVLPYEPGLLAGYGLKETELKTHYWNRKKKEWEALESVVNPAERTVWARTEHFSLYQVLGPQGGGAGIGAGAAGGEFGFREVYVFPNPARRGQSPTVHVEAGPADSVDIRVYDVAGDLKHGASLSGPQNAFEHAWGASGIASGVYIYVVTAHKQGRGSIRKVGQFAIIK